MRLTTILLLLGLPLLTQGQSNKACYQKIYQVTDTLPTLISSTDKLFETIKKEIKVPDSLRDRTGLIFIKYVINCHGETVNLRAIKTADSDGKPIINEFEFLSGQIIKILRRELKWAPAHQGGKAVDFYQIFRINFNQGQITISVIANE